MINNVSTLNLASTIYPVDGSNMNKYCKLLEFNNYNVEQEIYNNYIFEFFTFYNTVFSAIKCFIRINSRDFTKCKLIINEQSDDIELLLLKNGYNIELWVKNTGAYKQVYGQLLVGNESNVIMYKENDFEDIDVSNALFPTLDYKELNVSTLNIFNNNNVNNIKFSRNDIVVDLLTTSNGEFVIAYRGAESEDINNDNHTKILTGATDIKLLCPAGGAILPQRNNSTDFGGENNYFKNIYSNSVILKPTDTFPTENLKNGMTIYHSITHKFWTWSVNGNAWYDAMGNRKD